MKGMIRNSGIFAQIRSTRHFIVAGAGEAMQKHYFNGLINLNFSFRWK